MAGESQLSIRITLLTLTGESLAAARYQTPDCGYWPIPRFIR
jgi:hypothetical protein